MSFTQYLRFGSVELVNTARTSAYADNLNLAFFRCDGICDTLPEALEAAGWKTGDYITPETGMRAPWYDPAAPHGNGFAGVHVLDTTGFMSSTWEATVTEGLGDGGYVSPGRFRTREMTFRVLLLGTDLYALQHGFDWLSSVLRNGDPCKDVFDPDRRTYHMYRDLLSATDKPWWTIYKDTDIPSDDDIHQAPLVDGYSQTYRGLRRSLESRIPLNAPPVDLGPCEDARLEFFARCPDAEQQFEMQRFHLDVSCTQGPAVITTHEVGENCAGGAWAEVEFTLTAGNPFGWHRSIDVATAAVGFTYDDISRSGWIMYKNELPISDDNLYEAPLLYLTADHTYTGLSEALWRRLALEAPPVKREKRGSPAATALFGGWSDPACPPGLAFPPLPDADLLCEPPYEGPWTRLTYSASGVRLPKFTEAVLTVGLTAVSTEFKDLRVRFTRLGGDPDSDWESQFLISWIPDGATMRIDGARRTVLMWRGVPGSPSYEFGPASHLVLTDATAGSLQYPVLLCGGEWITTIDVPTAYDASRLFVYINALGRDG